MRQNPKPAVPRTANVVERAIAHVGGSPAELARRIGEYAGRKISRQVVNGWRMRGIFPREVMIHVERLTGITVEVTPWVHILTGIPIRELVQGREEQRVRRAERRRLNSAVR